MIASGISSAASGDADFTLVNRTGLEIREIYVSPTRKSDWGRDRMGDNTLANGASRHFKFGQTASCRQDLKVVFEADGTDVTWDNLDLCALEKVTIRFDRKTRRVSAETE
jgi:hypothetical protein